MMTEFDVHIRLQDDEEEEAEPDPFAEVLTEDDDLEDPLADDLEPLEGAPIVPPPPVLEEDEEEPAAYEEDVDSEDKDYDSFDDEDEL